MPNTLTDAVDVTDLAGFLGVEHPTDTSAPFFAGVLNSGLTAFTSDAVAPVAAPAATDTPWYVRFAQYGALALLAVILIGIGAVALLTPSES